MAANTKPVSDIDEDAPTPTPQNMELALQYAELKMCMDKAAVALDALGAKLSTLVGEDAMAVAVSPKRARRSPVPPPAPRKKRPARPLLEIAGAL